MQNVSKQPAAFNTHNVIKKLVAKGFQEPQAEEIVDAILEGRSSDLSQLATKEQVTELRSEMKSDIGKVRAEVTELRSEMRTSNERLRTEIEKAKLSAILIIGGLIAASTTVIGALIKYFSIH